MCRWGVGGLVLVLLTIACGSPAPAPTSESNPSPPLTVETADGTVTLVIPAGALPPGTDPDEVAVEAAELPTSMPGGMAVPVAGWVFSPDGLQLSAPAVVEARLPLDRVVGGELMLMHGNEGSLVPRPFSVEVDQQGMVELVWEVPHFSWSVLAKGPMFFAFSITEPGAHPVGEPVVVEVGVVRGSEGSTVRVWSPVYDEYGRLEPGSGTVHEWEVGPPSRQFTASGSLMLGLPFLPPLIQADVPPDGVYTERFSASAGLVCEAGGSGAVIYRVGLTFQAARLDPGPVGEIQDMFEAILTDAAASCVDPVEADPFSALMGDEETLVAVGSFRRAAGACGVAEFVSGIRLRRGSDGTVEVIQIHPGGIEQLSRGRIILNNRAFYAVGGNGTYDEVYLLRVVLDDAGPRLEGINVSGPEGSLANLADLEALLDVMAAGGLLEEAVNDAIDSVLGNVTATSFLEALGAEPGACQLGVVVEPDTGG